MPSRQYPPPDLAPEDMIQWEVNWLLSHIGDLHRSMTGIQRTILRAETRLEDLRAYLMAYHARQRQKEQGDAK